MANIRIDTGALTYPRFQIPGVTPTWVDGSSRPVLDLAPGTYNFQQASGYYADFTFRVNAAGKVEYDTRFEGFLDGAGTDTLTVAGFPVTWDGTALAHALLPMVVGSSFLTHTRTHELRLVPASHYGVQPASGVVADFRFGIDLDGKVVVVSAYSGFASAHGSTLVLTGYPIEIDATALSHDLVMLLRPYLHVPNEEVTTVRVLPARAYGFVSASGVVVNFGLAVDGVGNVVLDPAHTGFASASGRRLTLRGYRVKIDGRNLSHDLLPMLLGWNGGFLSRTRVHELTLLPAGRYGFQPGSGIVADMWFEVRTDGTIGFPSSCRGFLRAEGDTLVVDGYPVLVDARAADSDLLSIVNLSLPALSPKFLFAVLVPADGYQLQTRNGVFAHGFGVEQNGDVSYDPSLEGRFVISTIKRLEVRGTTPF